MKNAGKEAQSHQTEYNKDNRWMVGDVTITRIVEDEVHGLPPHLVLVDLVPQRVQKFPWLKPHYADDQGFLSLSVHAFVIESCGRRIIVDTCVGNDKRRSTEVWNNKQGDFLERLEASGFPANSIDTVLCTHMHVDHVGWNTRWDGSNWIPTFKNAAYLFGRLEWDHWQKVEVRERTKDLGMHVLDAEEVFLDSIVPIVNAGLQQLVEQNHQITKEVRLISTPGHTPGHVSIAIESQGKKAVITGDMIHHPVQIADPDIASNVDFDPETARSTRQSFLEHQCGTDTLVLGTHFSTPTAGWITRGTGGYVFCQSQAIAPE
ncbi:MBL fold hydrolase [Burkholderia lata]|uniref:MBL fold metallo-hydrolase n=1 Tax=Burkholderia lata (strain ATCC 17760 / DSM 23089 / LMG 22485 / NCIMB 9086 / R18194 / 383) TaxID=482957 RepID=UPI0014532913|nr:MBL fold metallo-hydrolase [Burkholderia lata]VWC06049.1 MBL fold hydrolase [Burkholderia lata]